MGEWTAVDTTEPLSRDMKRRNRNNVFTLR
jgi:hypothetical protein